MVSIREQPTMDVWDFENEWTEGICGCCTNQKECVYGFFCFPCYFCSLFERSGESCSTPILVPDGVTILRTKIRTAFRINGSICEDCLNGLCCPCCAALQMGLELEHQGL